MPPGPHSLIKSGKSVSYTPPFKSFAGFLQNQASAHPQKPALIFASSQNPLTLTYTDLSAFTLSLAHILLSTYHLKPGDYISYAFENTPEIILLNYAAWMAGLISVPLDVKRDTLDRKIYKLKLTHTKLFFTRAGQEIDTENARIKKSLPHLTILPTKDFPDFKQKLLAPSKIFNSQFSIVNSKLDSDCLILFTSGTTALPKGVRLNLHSLFANAASIADWLKFNDRDRFHILLPLHHINSTTFVNTTLLTGGTVILSPAYSKSGFWPTMADYQATGASIVPTVAYDLLSEEATFKKYKNELQQVSRIQIGSAPVQPTVVAKFMEKFNIPLYQGYGQTETSLRTTGVPMDLTPKESAHIRQLNSLGTELKYTNVTVLDETGQELAENKEGEICVRGPIIMAGYLNNPQATKEAFAHHWFHSGDTGFWQMHFGRKFFFMKGRTKEIIKKGGVLISPLAIENTLLKSFPNLDQVYAIGFPDARLGEEIGIVAVTEKPQVVDKILSLAKTCSISGLSGYESPQAAVIATAADLPKTSTNKVQRVKLKEIFESKLLENYRTISTTPTHRFRFVGPEEENLLKQAVTIHNSRWEENLKSSLTEFKSRAEHGLLIAALDKNNQVLGTISALKLFESDLEKPFTQTYAGITGNGTLTTHNHKGDSLICVAISSQNLKAKSSKLKANSKEKLTPTLLKKYLSSNLDPIIAFHRRPKAGLKTGATIVKVLKNSRPEDKSSLGYNILMKYPTPEKQPTINPQATIGTELMEAALLYAYQKNLKHIFVYTRPANLAKYFFN
ncbi:MAG: acyl--CoA ligase [Candidatus Chisholmbacteria bacterium]|nr:acyl--CoA ligase [Candidatus Chisholmbacteria bacterium]